MYTDVLTTAVKGSWNVQVFLGGSLATIEGGECKYVWKYKDKECSKQLCQGVLIKRSRDEGFKYAGC